MEGVTTDGQTRRQRNVSHPPQPKIVLQLATMGSITTSAEPYRWQNRKLCASCIDRPPFHQLGNPCLCSSVLLKFRLVCVLPRRTLCLQGERYPSPEKASGHTPGLRRTNRRWRTSIKLTNELVLAFHWQSYCERRPHGNITSTNCRIDIVLCESRWILAEFLQLESIFEDRGIRDWRGRWWQEQTQAFCRLSASHLRQGREQKRFSCHTNSPWHRTLRHPVEKSCYHKTVEGFDDGFWCSLRGCHAPHPQAQRGRVPHSLTATQPCSPAFRSGGDSNSMHCSKGVLGWFAPDDSLVARIRHLGLATGASRGASTVGDRSVSKHSLSLHRSIAMASWKQRL